MAALVIATLVIGWPLLLPWVYDTHDGHYALYNAAQFDQAIRDGQVPVRWLPDLFGGRGLPHFLYYHPLAFYLASGIHLTGLGFIASIKATHLLSLFFSGLAFYAWLSDRLPSEASAVGAVAYVLAPFRAVEVHVKGDPPAALAFVFLPLVLLAIDRAARGKRGGTVALALASAGLVLSHSVTAFLALPVLGLYALGELRRPYPRCAARIAAGVATGAFLSAFYWLPAVAERSLVHIDSPLGILFFDFREHFVAPWQWLSPLWGYHGSFAGTRDDMAFQIGPVHAVGIVALGFAWRKLDRGPLRRLAGWALAVTGAALIGTLAISRPVWEAIGPLRMVQFPWRLLSIVALGSATALALAVARLSGRSLVAAAAAAPVVITLAFALGMRNRWYVVVAGFYAVAGSIVWLVRRRFDGRAGLDAPLLCGLLCFTAAPWTAVPLHSIWKGEPARIAIDEHDLTPERVRLGIRRTTARDDYLPRTVESIPPRDPDQEYLPPADARPEPDVVVSDAVVFDLGRSSKRFAFGYDASAATRATLNLHDFPGWRAALRDGTAGVTRPLVHGHDERGRIVLDLPEGRGRVELRLERTPARAWGDALGVFGLALVAGAGLARFTTWTRGRARHS